MLESDIDKFVFSILSCISKHLCFHYIFKMLCICTYIHRDSLRMGKLQIQTDTLCFIRLANIRSCAVSDGMMKYSWKSSKFILSNLSSIYTSLLILENSVNKLYRNYFHVCIYNGWV